MIGANKQADAVEESTSEAAALQYQGLQDQLDFYREALGYARDDAEYARDRYESQDRRLSGIREMGGNALNALRYELGLGDQPGWYEGYEMSPMARFALEQGVDDIQASAAARGGLNSGATLQALEDYRSDLVMADRDNYLNRLADFGSMRMNAILGQPAPPRTSGQTANIYGNMAGAAGNYATNVGNLTTQAGQARANAIGSGFNAFNSTLGNMAGIYGYMNPMAGMAQGAGGTGFAPSSSMRPVARPPGLYG
jgi:hypothetical protein